MWCGLHRFKISSSNYPLSCVNEAAFSGAYASVALRLNKTCSNTKLLLPAVAEGCTKSQLLRTSCCALRCFSFNQQWQLLFNCLVGSVKILLVLYSAFTDCSLFTDYSLTHWTVRSRSLHICTCELQGAPWGCVHVTEQHTGGLALVKQDRFLTPPCYKEDFPCPWSLQAEITLSIEPVTPVGQQEIPSLIVWWPKQVISVGSLVTLPGDDGGLQAVPTKSWWSFDNGDKLTSFSLLFSSE